MKARFRYAVDLLRNSYWFTPGLMIVGAIGLSVATPALDRRWGIDAIREAGSLSRWIYTGGPEGAADVLSVIASSMITVAGVVFSITIVALTLASSQFGPRVLANFMADRGNQVVLGTFIATFLYSLLILRNIRGDGASEDVLVPHLSVTVALVLALASLCVLIFFIHHVSISIQAPHLIAVIAAELRHIARGFPLPGDQRDGGARTATGGAERRDGDPAAVLARHTGYVEAIDFEGLIETAAKHDLLIELERRPGHFIVQGCPFARAWPADRVSKKVAHEVSGMVATGSRRTAIQDVEFPVIQLVEVAVRALSPAINDPFTAITCIDQLGAGLCELSVREPPHAWHADRRGVMRVVIAQPVTFDGLVGAAFDQIRQNAAHHAAVHIRLLEAIATVLDVTTYPDRIDPLLRQARLVLERAREVVPAAADLGDIEERYRTVADAAARRRDHLHLPAV